MKRMSSADGGASMCGPPANEGRPANAGGNPQGGAEAGGAVANAATDPGRSLVVDEAFFEEQFLRCQVCHERFDQEERAPKSLPCNHTFCFPCLTQIFDHAQPPARRTLLWADETLDGTLKCPTCRVEIFLSRNKINELPNDHRVVQMMDFLSQAVAKSQNVCSKHERQPLNFFCKKCLVPVCRDCTVLDHKDSDGHVIIDVSEALSENSTQFSDIEKQSKDTLEKMKGRSDALANASKSLDILDRRLKNEIKETFIEYRLLLEKRQEALTMMVHQIVKDQKAKINARFVNVCEHGTQLQKLYDEFKASRHSNDIRKLFTINQQMKDNEEQFIQVATQEDEELFQSCEFEAQNEGCFLADMSGLGEVRAKPDPSLKEPVSAHQLVYLDMEQQRERQRFDESRLGPYGDCRGELMGMSHDQDSGGFSANMMMAAFEDSDEMPDHHHHQHHHEEEEDEEREDWPRHEALMSRLISHYANRHRGDPHEEMEHEGGGVSDGNRRGYRRGRRNRDTNSSQVSSSLSQERQLELNNILRAARAATSAATGQAPAGGYPGRTSSRSSQPSAYRVVRHPSASSLRHAANFPPEDTA